MTRARFDAASPTMLAFFASVECDLKWGAARTVIAATDAARARAIERVERDPSARGRSR